MNETRDGRWVVANRISDRKAVSPAIAAVLLVMVIVVVGAVGYIALSATGTSHTSTSSTCAPPTAPQCAGHEKPSGTKSALAAVVGLNR